LIERINRGPVLHIVLWVQILQIPAKLSPLPKAKPAMKPNSRKKEIRTQRRQKAQEELNDLTQRVDSFVFYSLNACIANKQDASSNDVKLFTDLPLSNSTQAGTRLVESVAN
jgi:hypothetical protein